MNAVLQLFSLQFIQRMDNVSISHVIMLMQLLQQERIGRVYTVHPNNEECYFLRILLHRVKGPCSFQDLKKVEGHQCQSFREACFELGLLEDDKHWDNALVEASIHLKYEIYLQSCCMCAMFPTPFLALTLNFTFSVLQLL